MHELNTSVIFYNSVMAQSLIVKMFPKFNSENLKKYRALGEGIKHYMYPHLFKVALRALILIYSCKTFASNRAWKIVFRGINSHATHRFKKSKQVNGSKSFECLFFIGKNKTFFIFTTVHSSIAFVLL